mgnify:CR=1 FL=1
MLHTYFQYLPENRVQKEVDRNHLMVRIFAHDEMDVVPKKCKSPNRKTIHFCGDYFNYQ